MPQHLKRHIRMPVAERKAQLLGAALKVARGKGFAYVNRDSVAAEADVTNGLIGHYFGSVQGLRTDLLEHAVAHKDAAVLASAASAGYPLPACSQALERQVKRELKVLAAA